MTFNPAIHSPLTMQQAANHLADGAGIFARLVLVDDEPARVVRLDPVLIRSAFDKDEDAASVETRFFSDFEGDLWLMES